MSDWDDDYLEALREVDEMCPGSPPIAPRRATPAEVAIYQSQANAAGYAGLEAARAQQNAQWSYNGLQQQLANGQIGMSQEAYADTLAVLLGPGQARRN